MPAKPLIVSIDRVERGIAVAESDGGRRYEIPVEHFPEKPAEGMVYRVPVGTSGPRWEEARADHAESERRRRELGDRMARLRKRDPGGDVEL